MGHAYTPGLKVTKRTIIKKERRLPLKGEVLKKVGDRVKAQDVVARTDLPGKPFMVNVVNKLAIGPAEVVGAMQKQVGDKVEKDELLAMSTSFFGLFKSRCFAPLSGTVEQISNVTGQVVLREPPVPVEVTAYIDGMVDEIMPEEGVIVKAQATFIQGIFGIGGEVVAPLKVVATSPDQIVKPEDLDDDCTGKIVVVGSLLTNPLVARALELKVIGLIAAGIDDKDLKNFLGYDLGVAITGNEKKGITFVVTEGFGRINMANKTFELLSNNDGMKASINGATQIRAGVIRPEVIIPWEVADYKEEKREYEEGTLLAGGQVRIIREPHFGELATVTDLPVDLHKLESESKARVLEVELDNGERFLLPLANVELIEN